MKAISLWQPWASLMAVGAKEIETRSWCTGHRGELVICASKKRHRPGEIPAVVEYWLRRYAKDLDLPTPALFQEMMAALPYGQAVAVVDLTDCIPTAYVRASMMEHDLGDYSLGLGRWAWRTENCRRLKKPVRIHGYQSVWRLSEAEESLVREQLA